MFSGTVKKRNYSIILSVFLLGLVCYLFVTWYSLQGKIQEQTRAIAVVNSEIKTQDYENNELQRIIKEVKKDNGNKSEYIEHIARKDRGYVMPGERVYYDISAGSN